MAFARNDLVEAMTTVESGVAIGQPYPKHEERATAIHEAGHAVCGHLYMDNRVSTRLSIRKRGSSGGHHQAMEVEDRFGHWRSEQVGDLIWSLGAMAAEHVFYDQTTTGVGGDIGMVTWRAAQMVGRAGDGPGADRPLRPHRRQGRARERPRRSVWSASRSSALQLMHRSATMRHRRPTKDAAKRKLIAQLLGQAFVVAWNTIRVNKRQHRPRRRTRLVAAGELYGDDVTDLLDECRLRKPEIDVLDESIMARDLIPPPLARRPPGPGRDAAPRERRRAEPDRARRPSRRARARGAGAAAGRPARRRSSATASASCSARSPAWSSPRCWSLVVVIWHGQRRSGRRRPRWPNWSAWQPSDTSIDVGADEIAKHVGAEYMHPDGKQLVDVSGGPSSTSDDGG